MALPVSHVDPPSTPWLSVGENGATVHMRWRAGRVEVYVSVPATTVGDALVTLPADWVQSGPWGSAHANARPLGPVGRAGTVAGQLYFPEPYPSRLLCTTASATARGFCSWPVDVMPTSRPGVPV
ncbi:hypothetical protein ACXET9_07375 [Brachybacterium sp. DNPG3]